MRLQHKGQDQADEDGGENTQHGVHQRQQQVEVVHQPPHQRDAAGDQQDIADGFSVQFQKSSLISS